MNAVCSSDLPSCICHDVVCYSDNRIRCGGVPIPLLTGFLPISSPETDYAGLTRHSGPAVSLSHAPSSPTCSSIGVFTPPKSVGACDMPDNVGHGPLDHSLASPAPFHFCHYDRCPNYGKAVLYPKKCYREPQCWRGDLDLFLHIMFGRR